MGLDIPALIGEVAKQHNVRLSADDPILITVTLNEAILAQHLEQVRAIVEASQNEVTVTTAQQVAAMKEAGSRMVTGAGGYVVSEVKEAGAVVKAELVGALRAEVERARNAATEARRAQVVAIWAAAGAITLCGGLVAATRFL